MLEAYEYTKGGEIAPTLAFWCVTEGEEWENGLVTSIWWGKQLTSIPVGSLSSTPAKVVFVVPGLEPAEIHHDWKWSWVSEEATVVQPRVVFQWELEKEGAIELHAHVDSEVGGLPVSAKWNIQGFEEAYKPIREKCNDEGSWIGVTLD